MLNLETKHFTFDEMCMTSHDDLLLKNRECALKFVNNLFNVMCVLEFIREVYGQPIAITSGFRSSALNTRVGGVPKSRHLIGRAADIRPASHIPNNSPLFEKEIRSLMTAVRKALELGLLGYVEYHPYYIHINLP